MQEESNVALVLIVCVTILLLASVFTAYAIKRPQYFKENGLVKCEVDGYLVWVNEAACDHNRNRQNEL